MQPAHGPAHSSVQGGQAAGRVQADDAPGKGIGNQAQVNRTLAGGWVVSLTHNWSGAVGLGALLTRLG